MSAYYNEFDPFAAQWLRNLISANHIAPGDVDDRSIFEVVPDDLQGYSQCHFFAGIGGWSYACRLAGIPDGFPLWTGSCPCQPFSNAGKRQGEADERHLWPIFRDLIAECSPSIIFGEQVASRAGREWLARVFADLEALGYAVAGADLCAASVQAQQDRARLWWLSYAAEEHGWAHGLLDTCKKRAASMPTRRFPRVDVDGRWWRPSDGGERMPLLVRNYHGLSNILAGFGNAIVPHVAAQFMMAALECIP